MKIRIKTYNGDLPSYLTMGRVYEGTGHIDAVMKITADDGSDIWVIMNCSGFLNGGSWEVVSE